MATTHIKKEHVDMPRAWLRLKEVSYKAQLKHKLNEDLRVQSRGKGWSLGVV